MFQIVVWKPSTTVSRSHLNGLLLFTHPLKALIFQRFFFLLKIWKIHPNKSKSITHRFQQMYWTIFTCREVICKIVALPNIRFDVACKHENVSSNCHFHKPEKRADGEKKKMTESVISVCTTAISCCHFHFHFHINFNVYYKHVPAYQLVFQAHCIIAIEKIECMLIGSKVPANDTAIVWMPKWK